jgi:hypothetical protein
MMARLDANNITTLRLKNCLCRNKDEDHTVLFRFEGLYKTSHPVEKR